MSSSPAPTRFCPECGQARTEDVCPVHSIPTIVQQQDDFTSQLIGQLISGKYKVESLIGQGGFGAVFRAINQNMRQEMVIKVLRPEYAKDPIQVQRFFNEGRMAAQLKETHTVKVFDFGQTDSGQLYLAMEYLRGHELARVLREQKTLEPMRAVRIAIAVLRSLAEAHDLGMVHRDLKPENVFLCQLRGEDDFVKLIDFGIAKTFEGQDQDLTKTGFAVGTPKYMSPEQGRAEPLDGRSDLYSLGIILYQCLTGDVPFRAPSAMGIIVKHLQEKPTPVDEAAPQPLPHGLADVVMCALSKRREDRFANADDMRAALEQVLETAGEQLAPTGASRARQSSKGMPGIGLPTPAATRAPTPGLVSLLDPTLTDAPPPTSMPLPELSRRERMSSGIGEMLERNFPSSGGGTPGSTPAHNPIGWVPPADGADAAAQSPSLLTGSAAPSQNRTPGQTTAAGGPVAQPRHVSSAIHGSSRKAPAPPSKTAGAWVFVLVITAILGGAGYWFWQRTQTDPEAMEQLNSMRDLVDKGKAKLDELTGSGEGVDGDPALKGDGRGKGGKPEATTNDDDAAGRRKTAKALKNKDKAEEPPPPPAVTIASAIAGTQDAVRKCYANATGKARDFTHVAVEVTVDSMGTVKRANLKKKFGTGSLAACVEKAAMQAKMPPDQPGDHPLDYDLPVPESDGRHGKGKAEEAEKPAEPAPDEPK